MNIGSYFIGFLLGWGFTRFAAPAINSFISAWITKRAEKDQLKLWDKE